MQACERDADSSGTRRRVSLLVTLAFLAALAVGPSFAAAQSARGRATSRPTTLSGLLAPGAKVRLFAAVKPIASKTGYAEGPLWLPSEHLIVSDVHGAAVLTFDASGKKLSTRRRSNVANGHALAADGSVLEAEAGDKTHVGRIVRISADGSVTTLADAYKGKHFTAPNDLVVKRDGTIWFTDPDYNELMASAIPFHGVYRLDPKTGVVTLATKALDEPNGIAFSPDQKTLYVSDTFGFGLVSFAVAADGTLGPKRFVDSAGCDGIGVDERGDVWETTCDDNVAVVSPAGKTLGSITFPGTTSNLAWGGAHGKTLFVTTEEGGVYSLALSVREAR